MATKATKATTKANTKQPKTEEADVMSEEEIQTKIVHILSIYPILSPTMLQSGLGPYVKPVYWRPVLAKLVEEGKVVEEQESMQTPYHRYNTYTKLSLPGTTVYVRDNEKNTVGA